MPIALCGSDGADDGRFFQDHAPFLPILDPSTTPNAYYDQSTLLFWTIVFVASRTYNKNPTLFPTLAEPILEMVLLSMGSNAAPVFKIQSFLLFLTWPPASLEVVFPLSGWLLHVAMQNGLHMPMASHEFGRNVRSLRSEPSQANKSILMMDLRRRSELWAYCIVVYQRYVSQLITVGGKLMRIGHVYARVNRHEHCSILCLIRDINCVANSRLYLRFNCDVRILCLNAVSLYSRLA